MNKFFDDFPLCFSFSFHSCCYDLSFFFKNLQLISHSWKLIFKCQRLACSIMESLRCILSYFKTRKRRKVNGEWKGVLLCMVADCNIFYQHESSYRWSLKWWQCLNGDSRIFTMTKKWKNKIVSLKIVELHTVPIDICVCLFGLVFWWRPGTT